MRRGGTGRIERAVRARGTDGRDYDGRKDVDDESGDKREEDEDGADDRTSGEGEDNKDGGGY